MTFGILTNTGRNKEAAALANGTPLTVTQMAWGDSARVPSGGEVALQNEQGRKPVQASGLVPNANNTAFFDIFLDENEGPFTIREVGLFDADGDMIGIAHFDPAVAKPLNTVTALIRVHVLFSDLENLVLKIQSVNAFVPAERRIDTGNGLTGGGDLSANRTLAADFATTAEARAGVSTTKVLSPATAAVMALQTGSVFFFAGNTVPQGALQAAGTAHDRVLYARLWAHAQVSGMYDPTGANSAMFGPGNGATTFTVPDWRGEFVRVWDNGRGVDAGRGLGTKQDDATATNGLEIQLHRPVGFETSPINSGNNTMPYNGNFSGSGMQIIKSTPQYVTGDSETRPRNIALMTCIKY